LKSAERGGLSRSAFISTETHGFSRIYPTVGAAAGGTPVVRFFWATRSRPGIPLHPRLPVGFLTVDKNDGLKHFLCIECQIAENESLELRDF
jgi:hypothetical protein